MFQALDYAIYQAEQNGVRLLLTLVNNWEDYGGKPQYVAWAKAAGENVSDADDFFRNSKCREYYKNHVKVRFHNLKCTQAPLYSSSLTGNVEIFLFINFPAPFSIKFSESSSFLTGCVN